MNQLYTHVAIATATIAIGVMTGAQAQPPVISTVDPTTAASGGSHWTTQTMQAAKPKVAPLNNTATAPSAGAARQTLDPNTPRDTGAGHPPTIPDSAIPPGIRGSMTLDQLHAELEAEGGIPASSSAAYHQPFTTSEVQPALVTTYPFRAVGRLFFTEQGIGDFYCSASVLKNGIVLTAGHCVFGQGADATKPPGFWTNFAFVPAYNIGARPYGTWTNTFAGTTGLWATGNLTTPNGSDFGMLVMSEQSMNGTNVRIGDITGTLGYLTNAVSGNHVSMFGYPCNLDNCESMIRTDAGDSQDGGLSTAKYGSASGGGASGGPWIQSFGTAPSPSRTGIDSSMALGENLIVSVTSYQPTADTGGYLGGSTIDGYFTALLNLMCSYDANACN